MTSLITTTPCWCRARIHFINRAVLRDLSYLRSESSGTSMLAEPADKAASENVCPILDCARSLWRRITRYIDVIKSPILR